MTLQDILADIHALEEELLAFERKYGLPQRRSASSAQYAQFVGPGASCGMSSPHHKHVPPDIKHHRIPAPGFSFGEPNLPRLIEEIEQQP